MLGRDRPAGIRPKARRRVPMQRGAMARARTREREREKVKTTARAGERMRTKASQRKQAQGMMQRASRRRHSAQQRMGRPRRLGLLPMTRLARRMLRSKPRNPRAPRSQLHPGSGVQLQSRSAQQRTMRKRRSRRALRRARAGRHPPNHRPPAVLRRHPLRLSPQLLRVPLRHPLGSPRQSERQRQQKRQQKRRRLLRQHRAPSRRPRAAWHPHRLPHPPHVRLHKRGRQHRNARLPRLLQPLQALHCPTLMLPAGALCALRPLLCSVLTSRDQPCAVYCDRSQLPSPLHAQGRQGVCACGCCSSAGLAKP